MSEFVAKEKRNSLFELAEAPYTQKQKRTPRHMSPLSRLGSFDDKTNSLPQVHIALTNNDMALFNKNRQDILLKNQQVFVDEKGRVGLVPTVMNRISDRCGAIPLEGKVISYFSAREQDFVNISQYPLDRDYVVHPDDIICLTPPPSSNEPFSS